MQLTRREAIALGALAGTAALAPRAGAREMEIANRLEDRLDLGYRSGLLHGLHAVLLTRGDETLLERYFGGEDENWGRPLGKVRFDADTLHDLRSVSKSMTSLLYGIALGEGKVPAPDAPLLDAFPQYTDLAADPKRAAWTVEHVLNMTLGTDWNEDIPYTDPANSEIMMERAADRYRFILDRPVIAEPGTQWVYNGGCSALLGYLIAEGTGQSLPDYARDSLFAPLGISEFEWNSGSDGVASAASGLRLTAPALTRIGRMVSARGLWQGRAIVPESWIDACMTPRVMARFGQNYSYQWYLSEQFVAALGTTTPMIAGMGNGGQRLYVLPALDIVMTVFAGHYNRPDQWMTPTLLLQRVVLQALDER